MSIYSSFTLPIISCRFSVCKKGCWVWKRTTIFFPCLGFLGPWQSLNNDTTNTSSTMEWSVGNIAELPSDSCSILLTCYSHWCPNKCCLHLCMKWTKLTSDFWNVLQLNAKRVIPMKQYSFMFKSCKKCFDCMTCCFRASRNRHAYFHVAKCRTSNHVITDRFSWSTYVGARDLCDGLLDILGFYRH